MLNQVVEIVYSKFPRIARVRSSSYDIDYCESKTDGTQIILRKMEVYLCGDCAVPCAEFVGRLTPQRTAALRRQLPVDSMSPADGSTLNDIMADPVSKENIFPAGIIGTKVGEVYDAHECNTFTITESCTAMFVSGNASSTYKSLSFGWVVTCSLGRIYVIDYYGGSDDSLILAQVSRHLPLAPEISREQPLLFRLCVPEACTGDEAKRRFHEFVTANITPGAPPPQYEILWSMTHAPPVQNRHRP
ncbi:hypothetical protein LSAT2_004624 [Lamellibrachia satsuma]|nr:hypothetical protein LSAT2_004624 [Lamellibrachia satsuma]